MRTHISDSHKPQDPPSPAEDEWELPAHPYELSHATKSCIAFAAHYWTSILTEPVLPTTGNTVQDLGLLELSLQLTPPSSQQLQLFQEALAQTIRLSMLEAFNWEETPTRSTVEHCHLAVDYIPQGALLDAAKAADLDHLPLRFPHKTYMDIRRGNVTIRSPFHPRPHLLYAARKKHRLVQCIERILQRVRSQRNG